LHGRLFFFPWEGNDEWGLFELFSSFLRRLQARNQHLLCLSPAVLSFQRFLQRYSTVLFIVTCPDNCKAFFRKDYTFECMKVPECSSKAIEVQSFNNQSQCLCLKQNMATFTGCGIASSSGCGLSQYWERGTGECLECPVGCLSCELDTSQRIECTSCRPDYSLFVTLSKNHYCERNSILSYCPGDYNKDRYICQLSSLLTKVAVLANRNLCLKNITNCLVCLLGSSTRCSFCRDGYYLSQGLCLLTCPQGSYPYAQQGVCLMKVIKQCMEEVPMAAYLLFSRDSIQQNADGLNYLLSVNFQLTDPLNDPVGSLFSYSARSATRAQIPPRTVNIAYSLPSCLRCQSGYGLTPLGKCRQCDTPCLECSFSSSSSTSCLKCDQYHRLVDNGCVQLDPTEMPCLVGQYRNESYICQDKCLQFFRPELKLKVGGKQFQVNCSSNCPDGLGVSREKGQLTCSKTMSGTESRVKLFGSKAQVGSQTFYFFITSDKLHYFSTNPFSASRLSKGPRYLQ
jgi:hypothetical protein